MLVEHRGIAPTVDPTARVATSALLCGDVRGPDLRHRVMPRQAAWLAAHRDDRVL